MSTIQAHNKFKIHNFGTGFCADGKTALGHYDTPGSKWEKVGTMFHSAFPVGTVWDIPEFRKRYEGVLQAAGIQGAKSKASPCHISNGLIFPGTIEVI